MLYLQDLRLQLDPLEDVVALIEKSVVDDPPASIRDGGVIKDGFDPELDGLRTLLRDGRGWISRWRDRRKGGRI